MSDNELKKYDEWLKDDGPAALVIREHLMPVEGRDGVVFPPTYAAAEDKSKFAGGYNIDGPFNGQPDGQNVCLIDSVGSQANRVEPVFGNPKYASLIPQITVKAGEKEVNLLEAGHRAGDALVRCTALKDELAKAFHSVQAGDAEKLAKIAPTSLVFGAWDSRETQVKVPRLVSSTIRAMNVIENTRSANYLVQQQVDYVKDGLLPEPADKAAKDRYSTRGFLNALATKTPGGVVASSGIRRDATLNLAALRLLKVGSDESKTLVLRRYILGLSLVAFTHPSAFVGYLRQGCTLVLDPEAKPSPREFVLVHSDGRRDPANLKHEDALAYAQATAKAFGVGESKTVVFDKELAKADVAGDGDKSGKKKTK